MTPETFEQWLTKYREAGLYKSMARLALELGCDRTRLYKLKQRGGNRRDALALAALLNGTQPYGEEK